ncbi:MAG: hypothetical protein HYZ44_10420 [Bacteroidetes bacterium]|nr:hypothetical protein [Bacteroidota bacterium]
MISIEQTLKAQRRLFAKESTFFLVWLIVIRVFSLGRITYSKRLENLFDNTFIIASGAQLVSKSCAQGEASKYLPVIKATIAHFIRLRSRLEEVEFLGSKELELKSTLVLDVLYDLEIPIRSNAFSGQRKKSTDPKILDCLAAMSKSAIESRLNVNN